MNFLQLFADTLEMPQDQVTRDAEIRTLEKWDSIAALGVLTMVDEKFNVQLSGDDFASVKTVGDLEKLVMERRKR
jgi:acyl carrier protein